MPKPVDRHYELIVLAKASTTANSLAKAQPPLGLRTGGDSDAPWGTWCSAAITGFDSNHTPPRNIGSENHPIYHFAAAKPKAYIIYLPPSNGESNAEHSTAPSFGRETS